jgi:hypothetical protein
MATPRRLSHHAGALRVVERHAVRSACCQASACRSPWSVDCARRGRRPLSQPARAVVLCVDEKSQIQALDRTPPILPMLRGTPERAAQDDKAPELQGSHAALDLSTGKVIGAVLSRHRAIQFKVFLRTLHRKVPAELDVHLVLDDSSTPIEHTTRRSSSSNRPEQPPITERG